jgi:hypothetical protein
MGREEKIEKRGKWIVKKVKGDEGEVRSEEREGKRV